MVKWYIPCEAEMRYQERREHERQEQSRAYELLQLAKKDLNDKELVKTWSLDTYIANLNYIRSLEAQAFPEAHAAQLAWDKENT